MIEEKLVILSTHAKDDPEKANLAFVLATTAQASETEVSVFLATEGVLIATKGYADDIQISGHPPLLELIELYISCGGKVLVCSPCASRRGIGKDQLINGAELVGASELAVGTKGKTCISL